MSMGGLASTDVLGVFADDREHRPVRADQVSVMVGTVSTKSSSASQRECSITHSKSPSSLRFQWRTFSVGTAQTRIRRRPRASASTSEVGAGPSSSGASMRT